MAGMEVLLRGVVRAGEAKRAARVEGRERMWVARNSSGGEGEVGQEGGDLSVC
jgi:hypothetical protein